MTLGQELKQHREEAGITLAEVSKLTHISTHFLQSIEADDYKALPGGIFSRSFVKSYARAIKFDKQRIVDLYQQQVGDIVLSDSVLNLLPNTPMEIQQDSKWKSVVVGISIVFVILIGVLAIYKYVKSTTTFSLPTKVDSTLIEQTPYSTVALPNKDNIDQQKKLENILEDTNSKAIKLELLALAKCYVKAEADHQSSSGFVLQPDELKTIQADDAITLLVGKISAVQIKLNGEAITLPSQDGIKSYVRISIKNGTPIVKAIKPKIVVPKPAPSNSVEKI